MNRFTLLGLAFLYGCTPSGDAMTQPPESVRVDAIPVSAFNFDEAAQVITLDTRVAPPQRRRFDIGLGSITIETVRVENQQLTIRYTPEIEGGYQVYECIVPVSPTPVEFKINRDGTPGTTSFDLSACQLIRKGNLHGDPCVSVRAPASSEAPISEAEVVRRFRELRTSVGISPVPGEKVLVRRDSARNCMAQVNDSLRPTEFVMFIAAGQLSALDREGDCWVVELQQELTGGQIAYFDDSGQLLMTWLYPEG